MKIIDACCYLSETDDYPENLIRQMDISGIDIAVVHPFERGFACENEAVNDRVIDFCRKYPARLIPSVTVNPWRRDSSALIARYLDRGAKILVFDPSLQGFNICGHLLDEICERQSVQKSKIPFFFHTGHYSFGAPSQLAMLALRFPDLTFIIGHAGATDFGTDVVPVCNICRNIIIESSFARPSGFIAKAARIGFDRAVFGSGFPQNSLCLEISEMKRLLPAENRDPVLGSNLLKILGGCCAH